MFLHLLESYLQAGVNCKHLHELKERELFIIFRTAYTKSEIIQLLYPIMGIEVDFKAAVLKHKDRVRSKQELAELLGMSGSELHRKFNARVWRNRSILASETKKQGNTIPAQLRFHLYKRGGIRVGFQLRSRFQQVLQEQFRLLVLSELRQEIKKAAKIDTDIQRFAILDNRLVNLDN